MERSRKTWMDLRYIADSTGCDTNALFDSRFNSFMFKKKK